MEWVGRIGYLLVEAFIQRILPFDRPTRYNCKEAMKENLILRRIEQRLFAELRRVEQVAVAGNVAALSDTEALNKTVASLFELNDTFKELVVPYLGGKKDYRNMWEEYFGMKIGDDRYNQMLDLHSRSFAMHQNADKRRSVE